MPEMIFEWTEPHDPFEDYYVFEIYQNEDLFSIIFWSNYGSSEIVFEYSSHSKDDCIEIVASTITFLIYRPTAMPHEINSFARSMVADVTCIT